MPNHEIQITKYTGMFRNLDCKVKRIGDNLIIDDRFKLNVPTCWWTDLTNDEKRQGINSLESKIKSLKK